MGDQRWADSLLHSVVSLFLSCGLFQWDGLNANESAALPKMISPPQVPLTAPINHNRLNLWAGVCYIWPKMNTLLQDPADAVPTKCRHHRLLDNIYWSLRQCVHVLFENEMLLHIEIQCFVWVLAIRSLYLIVAELNLNRADTDPTDTIHRLKFKRFKTTFLSTACLLKNVFY